MTSLFTRIQSLFVASAHAAIDQHENPTAMARQILRKIDGDRDRTRQQLVRSLATAEELEHRHKRLSDQHDSYLETTLCEPHSDYMLHIGARTVSVRPVNLKTIARSYI